MIVEHAHADEHPQGGCGRRHAHPAPGRPVGRGHRHHFARRSPAGHRLSTAAIAGLSAPFAPWSGSSSDDR